MGLKKLNSEYNSRYKTFVVHRPVTTKAKILSHPLDSAPEALESSRRAGLLSNQFSNISEPALQRKRIVPYKHNHNILSTTTVKEMNDKDWLEAVGNDEGEKISTSNNVKRKDVKKTEDTEYSSSFAKQKEKDSPVILASKEKIKQKSQEKRQTTRSTAPQRPFLEKSPERMPPAGMPTYIADPQDKRLLRPSDDLLYPVPFQENSRNSQTEYTERYIGSVQGREYVPDPRREESSNIDLATYKKVLLQRNDAYGLALRPGTSPVKQRSSNPTQKRSRLHTARRSSFDSKTTSSYVSEGKDKEFRKTYMLPKSKQKDEKFVAKARERTEIPPRRSDEESLSSIRSANDLEAKRKLKKEVKHMVHENKVQQSKNKNLYVESVSSRNSRSSYNEADQVKEELIPAANTRSKNAKNLNKRPDLEEESCSSVYSTRSFENTASRKRNTKIQTENRSTGIKNKTRGQVVSQQVTRGSARIRRDTERSHKDILDRGRSPTPEMRTAGQSRRHHLDVTTGSNNPLATGPDPRQKKVLRSLDYERASYDPSRYSDAGDSLISSHSFASCSDRGP